MGAFGGAVQAAGTIGQGYVSQAAGETREAELKRESDLAKIAAKESQEARLVDLQKTMGAISSLTAVRGLDASSPSAMAYAGGVQAETRRNLQREAFNVQQQSEAMRLAGVAARQTGDAALMSSYFTGAGQFIQSIEDTAKAFATGGA